MVQISGIFHLSGMQNHGIKLWYYQIKSNSRFSKNGTKKRFKKYLVCKDYYIPQPFQYEGTCVFQDNLF